MQSRTVVIDTGCCNLTSLVNAIRRCGTEPLVSRDRSEILSAGRIFLPGVGTAGAAMEMISRYGLADTVRRVTQPVLGICLGMQLLCAFSEESGGVDMLGLIDARVDKMDSHGQPLPHMGWNRTYAVQDSPLFRGIAQGAHFYYVHSYAAAVGRDTLARCGYGEDFSAAVARGNFAGVQFHPERSGPAGARLIANFLEHGL